MYTNINVYKFFFLFRNNKKRYQTIMTDKAAQRAGKRNKKKNKFHKK